MMNSLKRIGARLGRIAICLIALVGGAIGFGAVVLVGSIFHVFVVPFATGAALLGFGAVVVLAEKLDLVPAPEETNRTTLSLKK